MKAIIGSIAVLLTMLLTISISNAQSIGIGGGHQDGHSWSGDYSVDQGYVGYIYTETSRLRGFTFGIQLTHREYTTTINAKGGRDLERKDISADALTAMVRYYPVDERGKGFWRILQPFVGVHAGYEVASDDDAFITAGQAGLGIKVTERLTVESTYTYWVRPVDRNYKTATVGLKWSF
jgi:hypothetical protein